MKDRIVACIALLIFAMMLHPQRRDAPIPITRQRNRFPHLRRRPAVS
jgi:hypothetical protein